VHAELLLVDVVSRNILRKLRHVVGRQRSGFGDEIENVRNPKLRFLNRVVSADWFVRIVLRSMIALRQQPRFHATQAGIPVLENRSKAVLLTFSLVNGWIVRCCGCRHLDDLGLHDGFVVGWDHARFWNDLGGSCLGIIIVVRLRGRYSQHARTVHAHRQIMDIHVRVLRPVRFDLPLSVDAVFGYGFG